MDKDGETDPPKRVKRPIGDHEAIRTPSSFVTQRTTLFLMHLVFRVASSTKILRSRIKTRTSQLL